MSGTQFFQRQDTQRKYTRILVGGFIAAMLLVILVINLVVIVGFCWFLLRRGMSFASSGETTSTLRAPLAPLAFFIAASWAASAAAAAARVLGLLRTFSRGRGS